MAASVTMKLDGTADALRLLGKVEPDIRKQAPKELKGYVAPVIAEMKSAIPAVALSGWNETGRIGWRSGQVRSGIRSKFRASKNRGAKSREFSLLSIIQTNAAGIIFDMAGRKSNGRTPQGRAMIRNLNAGHGNASRTLWPILEKNRGRLEDGLREILDRYSAQVNRKLR